MPQKKILSPPSEPPWIEGAGILLLLAAAHETQLIPALLTAATLQDSAAPPVNPQLRLQQVLTLLFLNAVGLQRTWDLRSYTGAALALATGRSRTYGYRHTERVLSTLAATNGDVRFTDAITRWTSTLWQIPTTAATVPFYLDGHKKPVYSDRCIPQGLVGRRGTILGCRHLTVLHDQAGHPLLALTDRGDTHLTRSVPPVLARFEALTGTQLRHLVIDREGMAATFLQTLTAAGRSVTTILRTNQYRDLGSFRLVGDWTPMLTDASGKVVREVAPAQFDLAVPTTPATMLPLQVALIRDHRCQVPSRDPEAYPTPWDLERGIDVLTWQPTAAPAMPTEAKLIPIVSTGGVVVDAPALVEMYRRRWPAQENSFKDFLLPLGLDVNHGYQKQPVENSAVAKQRTALETRMATLTRWIVSSEIREGRASKRYARCWADYRADAEARYREINRILQSLEAERVDNLQYRATRRDLRDAADAEIAIRKAIADRAFDESEAEYQKQRRYRKQQRQILRALEDLTATERQMYELDNRKDQVMTTLKVALVNLILWTRDQWFPPNFAQATWAKLAPFFRLPGRVHRYRDRVVLELRSFNDAALRRDLVIVCERVMAAAPCFPDGRRLEVTLGARSHRRPSAPYVSSA